VSKTAMQRAREELAVMGQILDVLEPIESDAKRLRVLAAVAVLNGMGDVARRALGAAEELEASQTETP
jgi:hypothetical protein